MLLCPLTDIADGASKGFDALGIFVVRQGLTLHGYRDACPHYGDTKLAWRRDEYLDADDSHIVCAGHGALFDIASGACVQGACLGQSLTAVPLRIVDGQVWMEAA